MSLPGPISSAGLLQKAAELCAEGVGFALVTIVRAVAPTSGKPGDKAILTERGEWFGWVGGSCAEPAARRAARAALDDGECRLLHLTGDAAEPPRVGVEQSAMTCYSGGSLEIYVEPQLPERALIVFGGSPIALALSELGAAMGYRVTRVEPNTESPTTTEGHAVNAAGARVVGSLTELERPDRSSSIVVASHGRHEDEALLWALSDAALSNAALSDSPSYVGLVVSRKRLIEVQGRLRAAGLSDERLARLRAPAGLDIGAKGPREVALSVLAQIVAERRGAKLEPRDAPEVAATKKEVAATKKAASIAAPAQVPSCCDVDAARTPQVSSSPEPSRQAPRAVRKSSCCDPEPGEVAGAPSSLAAAERQLAFSAVVLAAGLSRRMGAPNKLLLPAFGEPMIRRVLGQVLGAAFKEVVVVLGHQAAEVGAAIASLGLRTLVNEAYESGQVSSVRTGLAALVEPVDAVMVCLGDQPLLTTDDLLAVQTAFARRPHGSILVPMVGTERGNPVCLDWASVRETLARGINFGCRHFMDEHADRVYAWPATSDHFVRDIDQPAQYQALLLQTPA